MRIGGLDGIIQLYVSQLCATDDLFLLFRRKLLPVSLIVEVLLYDNIATRGECGVLVGDEGDIKSLLSPRILCPVDEADEVAAVEETESMLLIYWRDCGPKPGHDSRRQLEAQIHPLRTDMEEHV